MERDSNPLAAKILLLAAVLLLTGACGASTARDDGHARATSTITEESAGRPPTGGTGTSSPDREPDLTGTVTENKHGDKETNTYGWILVEEDPGVEYSAGPNAEGW